MSNFHFWTLFRCAVDAIRFPSKNAGISSACRLPINGCCSHFFRLDRLECAHKSPIEQPNLAIFHGDLLLVFHISWSLAANAICPTNAIFHFVLLLGGAKTENLTFNRTNCTFSMGPVSVRSFVHRRIFTYAALYNVTFRVFQIHGAQIRFRSLHTIFPTFITLGTANFLTNFVQLL